MLKVIERLASSRGRRDNIPNQELAEEIVRFNDIESVEKLISILTKS